MGCILALAGILGSMFLPAATEDNIIANLHIFHSTKQYRSPLLRQRLPRALARKYPHLNRLLRAQIGAAILGSYDSYKAARDAISNHYTALYDAYAAARDDPDNYLHHLGPDLFDIISLHLAEIHSDTCFGIRLTIFCRTHTLSNFPTMVLDHNNTLTICDLRYAMAQSVVRIHNDQISFPANPHRWHIIDSLEPSDRTHYSNLRRRARLFIDKFDKKI